MLTIINYHNITSDSIIKRNYKIVITIVITITIYDYKLQLQLHLQITITNYKYNFCNYKRNYKIFTKIQSFSVIESTYIHVAPCQLKIHNITESHDSKSHGGSSGCPCTVYETGAPLFCDDLPVGTVGLRSACHFFNLTREKTSH